MTLVVENGTGLSTAESYISVADASTRHTNFGNTAWTGSDAVKEAALRQATAYMLQAYRLRWQGLRKTVGQALDWPRYDVLVDGFAVDTESVPAEVKNACADLAVKALAGVLNDDLTRTVIREKVGPLETEYSAHSPEAKRYRAMDMALAPYLSRSSAMALLVRA